MIQFDALEGKRQISFVLDINTKIMDLTHSLGFYKESDLREVVN